jgi:hypothetical protein
MRKTPILAVLLAALPMTAQAQSVRQVFHDFGLFGVWAPACDQPPSADNGNTHAIYALAAGKGDGVMLTYDNGPNYTASVYTILSAERSGRDRLIYLEERLHDKKRVTVTVHKNKDAISLVSSVLADGTVLVRDGRRTASGEPIPPQLRCLK